LDFEKSGIVFLKKTPCGRCKAPIRVSSAEYRLFLDSYKELLLPALQQEEVYLQTSAYAPASGQSFEHAVSVLPPAFAMRIKSRLIGFIVGARTHVTCA